MRFVAMLQRVAEYKRRAGLFVGVVIVGLALGGLAKVARDRGARAQQSPVLMDDLQVNQLATFMNHGYWNISAVVIGQEFGGAVSGVDSEFVSYSTTGPCATVGCAVNAEWHDVTPVIAEPPVAGAGPATAWYVRTGTNNGQGQAAMVKVAKHNATVSDAGGDYQVFVRQTTAQGGGLALGFSLDANLHVNYATENVSPTSCGSGPSMQGGDVSGFGTTGTGATACTIPWTIPYDSFAPGCLVQVSNSAAAAPTWVESTTNLVVTFATPGTYALRWQCAGGT